jgi:hypothetical protein
MKNSQEKIIYLIIESVNRKGTDWVDISIGPGINFTEYTRGHQLLDRF